MQDRLKDSNYCRLWMGHPVPFTLLVVSVTNHTVLAKQYG
jgi:hypothetical protein